MIRLQILSSLFIFSCAAFLVHAQPRLVDGAVKFEYLDKSSGSVSLVGDFNAWSKDENVMKSDGKGRWSIAKKLQPGIYQYKFVVDGTRYENDPDNPAMVENYNKSGKNTVFVLTESNEILLTNTPPQPKSNPDDEYSARLGIKPVYLNIIWHQHQPLYVNPEKDQLQGPWVRTHATKDYYDMAAILRKYPDIHCNINLTSSLLHQLREYYLNRLGPFVDTKRNRIDVRGFWKKWKGKTDPWVDLALKPAEELDKTDKSFLYENAWNAFGISEVMIERFPEYAALKEKLNVDQMPGFDIFTKQELREIKFWFYLAYFDPDFLLGPVKLPNGSVVNLSDYVEARSDKKFYLKKKITETDCQRMVVEAYKVMANVLPIHKELRYDAGKQSGQIEIITTPYYHPILPLIYDSDLARICQPNDQLPSRFNYPADAHAQVAKAVKMYKEIFGVPPQGMWPGEGSVARPILDVLRVNGIKWTASDVKVLAKSDPPNQPNTTPYRFSTANPALAGASGSPMKGRPGMWMALVFRDTELSDRIGFKYQTYRGEDAAEDFVKTVLSRAPKENEDDVLITVILDGENAWEWYRQDIDGKEFLNSLYRKLTRLYTSRQIITTTTSEYITGNPTRGIGPHPVESLPAMKSLWPGSWINGNFDTWIGEKEENRAWEYLLRARQDLEKSGLTQPDPSANAPKGGTKTWYAYKSWEEMYAAEGSDWFWWYGDDQSAPAGDKPFDDAFRIHLNNIYKFAALAGADIVSPGFDPIIADNASSVGGQGTMTQSKGETQLVTFTCDASREKVNDAVFIVGSIPDIGSWTPNTVRMYDDGTHGDLKDRDGIWSLQVAVPIGEEIQYKYTNSGRKGEWVPGEEFSGNNRSYRVAKPSPSVIIINDTFGKK
jgi:alpha-amylase/alpha-mannosidase (GH57 family)